MINPLPLLNYCEDKSVTGIEFISEEAQLIYHNLIAKLQFY